MRILLRYKKYAPLYPSIQYLTPIDCEFISFFQAAGEMGIAVCNVPGYGVEEVYKKYQKNNIKKYKKRMVSKNCHLYHHFI